MYLDTEKILRLACYRNGSLEGDDSVDVRCCRLPVIGISRPPSFTVPGEIVGGLAVLHDGRNTIVVIRLCGILTFCFSPCFGQVFQLLLPVGQFLFKLGDAVLVGIVLLSENRCILYCRVCYLLNQRGIFLFQLLYLALKKSYLLFVFLFQLIQF